MVKLQRVVALMRSCNWLSVSNKLIPVAIIPILFFSFKIGAVVNVEKTRVIFDSGSSVESLSLRNSEKEPVIVQVWTDDGDPTVTPDKAQTPIVIQPSVFKMKPSEIRNLRLLVTPNSRLLTDRENIFWLNIFQIPPNTKSNQNGEQRVVLPLKIRMKVLVRPTSISRLEIQDAKKLDVSFIHSKEGIKIMLYNPTPWHLSISRFSSVGLELNDILLKPFSKEIFDTKKMSDVSTTVEYEVINDDGFKWFIKKSIKNITN